MRLVKADMKYKEQIIEMLNEWESHNKKNGEVDSPTVIFKYDHNDFEKYINALEQIEKEENKDRVPSSIYFGYDETRRKIVGAIHIRHYLNEALSKNGGHIGDGVRPSERRKGYATAIISLALRECKKLGIKNVSMMCNKDNVGSAKAILKNNGILQTEEICEHDGVIVQKYIIKI